jgi:hypothetical protein
LSRDSKPQFEGFEVHARGRPHYGRGKLAY